MLYVINKQHRDGNPLKSQWIISEHEELRCFALAQEEGWLLGEIGWGLHITDAGPDWLGMNRNRENRVFIAKFVGVTIVDQWHGYPADYRNNCHDIPKESVLRSWMKGNLIKLASIRKIAKGQPCSL